MQIHLKTVATIRGIPDLEGAVAFVLEMEPGAQISSSRALGGEGPGVFEVTYDVECGD